MRVFPLLLLLTWLTTPMAVCEEKPYLDVYQIVKEDWDRVGGGLAKLNLKLVNPTDQPLYFYSFGISHILNVTEVFKEDEWENITPGLCGTGMTLQTILPKTYIVFQVLTIPDSAKRCNFRVKTQVYKKDPFGDEDREPIELVSRTFSTREFRPTDESDKSYYDKAPHNDTSLGLEGFSTPDVKPSK